MLYKFKVLLFFYYISNYLLLKPTQPGEGKVTLALMGHLRFGRITGPLGAKQERKMTGALIQFIKFYHGLPRTSPTAIHSQDAQGKSVLDPRSTQDT